MIDDHDVFIAVDAETRKKILSEVLQQEASASGGLARHEASIDRREAAKTAFRKVAMIPAGLGLMAAVAGSLLAMASGTTLSHQVAAILPASLAVSVGLGNLLRLRYRP